MRVSSRRSQARGRLRAAICRIDEIALEMRGQHARAVRRRYAPKLRDLIEHRAQSLRRTRDRRRTERRHAPTRQIDSHRADRASAIERVAPIHAMDVDVDEAWDDGVAGEIDDAITGGNTRVGN